MFKNLLIFLQVSQIHFLTPSVIGQNVNVTEKANIPQLNAGEFFYEANTVIHKALNEIFHLLHLPSIAIENGTLHKLLKTYAELKKVNIIGHKIYHDIELMTRVNKTIDNSTINFVVDINELTMETLYNHLTKNMPPHKILQDAMKPKPGDRSYVDIITTVKEADKNFQYRATVNISQYQETNLTLALDQISSVTDDLWEPESEIEAKIRELVISSRPINNGRKMYTTKESPHGEFRDWYDEQTDDFDQPIPEPDPYHNPLMNMSLFPIEYVLINSKERDQKIKENSNRPLEDLYSTVMTTESTPVEIYTSIIYLDEEDNTTKAVTRADPAALSTRLWVSRPVVDDTRREYDGGIEGENRSESLDGAEINAMIRAERD